jgi:hypothetical protein
MELKKSSFEEYQAKRQAILQSVREQKYGNMEITEDELAANEIFKKIAKETKMSFRLNFILMQLSI